MNGEDWNKVETEFWNPENAGDEISGVFVGLQVDVGENKSNVYTVEVEKGKNINFWGATVLDRKMNSVKVGQEVKVVYLGKVSPEGGREYKDFDVFFRDAPMSEAIPAE